MKKIKTYINNSNISRFRFYVQIISFILIIYGGYAYLSIGQNLPTFACPYNHATAGNCFLITLQHQLHNTWNNLFGFRGIGLLTALISFLLFFIILNKAWCGYICPLGTIQDWLTLLRKRLGIRFARYEESTFKKLKKVKYILLLWLLIAPLLIANSIFGLPKLSHDFFPPFCIICPARTTLPLFTADTSQIFIDFSSPIVLVMTSLGIIITGMFLVGSFVKKRFFCLFCPMSALHYLFSRLAILRLTKDGAKCTKCGNCFRVCDVNIVEIADDIFHKNIVQDDCMMCFKCVEACPEDGCLKVSIFNFPVFSSTEEGFFRRYGQLENKEVKDA